MAILATSTVSAQTEKWQGVVESGQHRFLTDKPEEFEGKDTGPAPYDFLLASLGSCTMITLRMYAAHKEIDLGAFHVETVFYATKADGEWIERKVIFQASLDDALLEKVAAICEKTPVTKTLLRSLPIRTQVSVAA